MGRHLAAITLCISELIIVLVANTWPGVLMVPAYYPIDLVNSIEDSSVGEGVADSAASSLSFVFNPLTTPLAMGSI